MTINGAMTLFLLLLFVSWSILQFYGGISTLFFASMFFLFGLIMKRKLTKRISLAAAQPIKIENLSDEFHDIPNIQSIRENLAKIGFKYYKSFIIDEIGRYVEIFILNEIFSEIVFDEDDSEAEILFHTFFNNSLTVTSKSGKNMDYHRSRETSTEFHCLPEENLNEVYRFHVNRITTLKNRGLTVEPPDSTRYGENKLSEQNVQEDIEEE